jgi:hypothetical protein
MLNRLKISLVLIPLAIVLVVGIYVYSLWASERRRAAEVPVEATSMMMRDLLAFHKKRGGFPSNLKQLEGVVWEKTKNRHFSIDNRALSHRNYFYLYTGLTPHRYTLWAIPMGELREESPTWFLAVRRDSCRRWKGPTLGYEDVKKISIDPSLTELGVLGLTEQHAIELKNDEPHANQPKSQAKKLTERPVSF